MGEYLDYKNCICRKSLIDTLVEEYSENIDENKMTYNGFLNDYKTYAVLAQHTLYYLSLPF